MANADFSQNRQTQPGGFDASSYREAQRTSEAVQLTPLQKKLASFEARLPAALSTRAAAAAISIVIIAAGFLGIGSAKLRAKYNDAKNWYSSGIAADGGYTLSEELAVRENTAANIILTAKRTDGIGEASPEVAQAQAALDEFAACRAAINGGSGVSAAYEANVSLGKAIDQLYAKMQENAANPMKMGAVQGQYGQFNSAQTTLGALTYNDAVSEYEAETGGLLAGVLKGLAGIGEVEQFA